LGIKEVKINKIFISILLLHKAIWVKGSSNNINMIALILGSGSLRCPDMIEWF